MKAALYLRVSTQKQADKDLSIPDQRIQLTEYCERKGYEIVEEFAEKGASARDDRRPVFKDMVSMAMRKGEPPFNAIIVLTTSRFFRNAEQSLTYRHRLAKRGVKVIAVLQEFEEGPAGNIMLTVLSAFDQYESEMTGVRTLGGLKENAKGGFFNGSYPPFGYYRKPVDDKNGNKKYVLAVEDEESIKVAMIFDMYVKGMGGKAIAEELNMKGILKRQAQWDHQKILDLISNPVYVGKYIYNKKEGRTGRIKPEDEWIIIPVDPILSDDIFNQAQRLREKRNPEKTNPAISSAPTLLTGLVKCGLCGANMTLDTARGGSGEWYRYYNCRNFLRKGKQACVGNRVPAALLEKAVLEHISDYFFSEDRIKSLLLVLRDSIRDFEQGDKSQKQMVTKRLKQVQDKLQRQFAAIENGIISLSDVGQRIKELKQEQEKLEFELKAIEGPSPVYPHLFKKESIKNCQIALKKMFMENKQGLTKNYLNMVLDRIVLHGKSVEIIGSSQEIYSLIIEKAVGESVPTAILTKLPGDNPLQNSKKGVLTENPGKLQSDNPLAFPVLMNNTDSGFNCQFNHVRDSWVEPGSIGENQEPINVPQPGAPESDVSAPVPAVEGEPAPAVPVQPTRRTRSRVKPPIIEVVYVPTKFDPDDEKVIYGIIADWILADIEKEMRKKNRPEG